MASDREALVAAVEPAIPATGARGLTLPRRSLLAAGASLGLGLGSRPGRAGGASLAALGAAKGILVGTATRGASLARIPPYAAVVEREFDLIVSGVEMQWKAVAPTPERTDFSRVDPIAAWAAAHGKKFRGHALVWYKELPDWFAALPGRDAALAAMQAHIRTMCSHFAGHIYCWDVVNEALSRTPSASRPFWGNTLTRLAGPDFFDIAFHTARETDPRALLCYNDYAVELDSPEQRDKQAFLVRFIHDAKQRGVPIDVVGIQSHLRIDQMEEFDDKAFAAFLAALAGTGVKIMLTELDVADRGAPGDPAARDQQVAAVYKRYLDVALANRSVIAVITWGFVDTDSWVTRGDLPEYRRNDGQAPRPLPFDGSYAPKPAYEAIAAALRSAPSR
jgi:endo-1,4-beta-xylanase